MIFWTICQAPLSSDATLFHNLNVAVSGHAKMELTWASTTRNYVNFQVAFFCEGIFPMQATLASIVKSSLASLRIDGKCGKSVLQPHVADALRNAGFTADTEDARQLLQPKMPVWRSKDTGEVDPTHWRRAIDIVAYDGSKPVALIETESDLDDLRLNGVSRRNGHYDVWSISRSKNGKYFDSYKSLERMASAAFYHGMFKRTGRYPNPDLAVHAISEVVSNDVEIHNPLRIEVILVTGTSRKTDREILAPRLRSLAAELISVAPDRL